MAWIAGVWIDDQALADLESQAWLAAAAETEAEDQQQAEWLKALGKAVEEAAGEAPPQETWVFDPQVITAKGPPPTAPKTTISWLPILGVLAALGGAWYLWGRR